jgi:hypothetical protein
MKRILLALPLLFVAGTAFADARTQVAKIWGWNIHIVMSSMAIENSVKCNNAQWRTLGDKAREITEANKPSEADNAKMKKLGMDPSKPGQYLKYNFAGVCFNDGSLGIRFPGSGEAKEVYMYREKVGWYSDH